MNREQFDKIYQAGGIVINDSRHQVKLEGKLLDLTPIEYKILCKFVRQPNTPFSFADLADESHAMRLSEGEARILLRTHLYRLSRKLGDRDTSPLQNVRGRGYMLCTMQGEGVREQERGSRGAEERRRPNSITSNE